MKGRVGLAVVAFLVGLAAAVPARANEAWLLRDYPGSFFLGRGGLEISADYLLMNGTLDVFNFRGSAVSTLDPEVRSPSLGDLYGGRLLVNYGLFPETNLHFEYSYRDLELGVVDVQFHTAEASVRQGLLGNGPGKEPLLVLDAGVRINKSNDESFTNISHINAWVKQVDPDFSVRETDSEYQFSDGSTVLSVPKAGNPRLEVALRDMQDVTAFLRLTLGSRLGNFWPNLYVEYGATSVRTELDSNLPELLPEEIRPLAEVFPVDEDRDEHYWKGGFDMQAALPLGLLGNLDYSYIRLSRSDDLSDFDDNHILSAELSYFLTDTLALHLGGTYYRRQFNGVIPFTYNRQSQSSFDNDYGVARLGLSGTWDIN
ncbi:hypothetical protein DESUT3_24700 [Desulfuromonas versatilis]|uniref:DUF3570 domain-containing protein n=1 Tax=Desulfuromonas versatilis TaxID=2802975 RepID=A0ABN6DZ34_9BACT|nr:hypothetical protein [Desulfuromonas versatilis]BCR05401.1 hypothetical protein DESUT3_24700 [Desulfuromonas versatilis]